MVKKSIKFGHLNNFLIFSLYKKYKILYRVKKTPECISLSGVFTLMKPSYNALISVLFRFRRRRLNCQRLLWKPD